MVGFREFHGNTVTAPRNTNCTRFSISVLPMTNSSNNSGDTVQLSLRVPNWLRDRLHDQAERDYRSVNQTVIRILTMAMDREEVYRKS